ncbi:MAG: extracellular solute-binding protein [Erysipelotrichaceae bacterium]
MKKLLMVAVVITALLVFATQKQEEDTIIIYSSMEQFRNDELQEQLNQRYKDFKVFVMYMPTAKAAAKISVEKTNSDADIVVALETAYLEKIKDSLAVVEPYSKLDYLDDVSHHDNRYVIWERQAGSMIVNNDILKKHHLQAPKTYEDLLKPEYKGLVAMPDPKSSGTGYFFYKNLVNNWGEEKTIEYIDKLSKNIKQFTESGSGPVKMLIQGEIAVGLGLTFQGVNELNNGNPFTLSEPEFGSPYSLTGTSMIKGREKDERIKDVFDFIINDFLIYDKENFSPETIYKNQINKMDHYPNWTFGDMHGIADIKEKERLLSIWKY